MGKYTGQVHSYSNGVSKIKSRIEETLIELKEIEERLKQDASVNCVLNTYVDEFNKDMIEELETLSTKCFSIPNLLLRKATELDEMENASEVVSHEGTGINVGILSPISNDKIDIIPDISDINLK